MIRTASLRRALPTALLLALAALLAGCSNDDPSGPGGSTDADLTFSASVPANGNGHLDAPTVTYDPNADSSGLDRLTVTQTVSGIAHTFYFYFVPATGAVHSAQHIWGPAGGLTQCVGLACISANAVVNTANATAVFTNLILGEDPVNGTAISTVSGTINW